METFTTLFNVILGIGSIIALIIGIANFIFLFSNSGQKIQVCVQKHILWFGLLITSAGVIGSLIYSNVIGYPPCMFCWYARIFLYPQMFMFAYALYKKDRGVLPYAMILTIIGIIVSTYHYFFIDIARLDLIPCGTQAVSCSIRYVYEFGFVTIPFMGFASFVLLGSLLAIATRKDIDK